MDNDKNMECSGPTWVNVCGFIYASRWVKLDKLSGMVLPTRKSKEKNRNYTHSSWHLSIMRTSQWINQSIIVNESIISTKLVFPYHGIFHLEKVRHSLSY